MTTSHKNKPPGMVSHMALKDRPNWTETAIEKFLGQPDRVTPWRKDRVDGPTIRFFTENRIQAVEGSEAWIEWVSQAEARRKRWERRNWIAKYAPVYVRNEGQSVATLVQEAVESVAARRLQRGLSVEGFTIAELRAADLERILTNYIRHRYTNYDRLIKKLDQQPNESPRKYIVLRRRVLKAMSQAFPDLREVFERQLAARERWDVEKADRLVA